jgi:hypothetical protein
MRLHIFMAVAALGAVSVAALPASAQWGRAINVDGQWLSQQQIAQADQIAGFVLPNGYYWTNPQTCTWGVVGNPAPVGRIPCGGNAGGGGNGGGGGRDGILYGGPGLWNIRPDLK